MWEVWECLGGAHRCDKVEAGQEVEAGLCLHKRSALSVLEGTCPRQECGTTLQGGEVGSQSSGGVRMVARLGCGDLLGYGRRSAWDEGAHSYGATPHLWACSPPVSIFDAWPEAAGEVESR